MMTRRRSRPAGRPSKGGQLTGALLTGALLALPLTAALLVCPGWAEQGTRLLAVDLETGARSRIEDKLPKTAADDALDALLDKATGGAAFSTKELERIEQALRRFLAAARPRATPRLLLFLYPGRISANLLKELKEVKVDIELVVDPCGRSVCVEAVGNNLELLGRAMRQTTLRTRSYRVQFNQVVIRTAPEARGSSYEVYRFAAERVVEAGQSIGGGARLLKGLSQARDGYAGKLTSEVARQVQLRRVKLRSVPQIAADRQRVTVQLEVAADRVRYQSQVLGALLGAAEALRRDPLTPPQSTLEVTVVIPQRGVERKRFRCLGPPLMRVLSGKLSQNELWSTYVVEQKQGGTHLAFDDEEARSGAAEPDDLPDRTSEILGAHFNSLAPCLSAEAGRNRRFTGVTLQFQVSGQGKAVGVGFKERQVSAALSRCLQQALSKLPFQRHGGAPRRVEYPMYIKR